MHKLCTVRPDEGDQGLDGRSLQVRVPDQTIQDMTVMQFWHYWTRSHFAHKYSCDPIILSLTVLGTGGDRWGGLDQAHHRGLQGLGGLSTATSQNWIICWGQTDSVEGTCHDGGGEGGCEQLGGTDAYHVSSICREPLLSGTHSANTQTYTFTKWLF